MNRMNDRDRKRESQPHNRDADRNEFDPDRSLGIHGDGRPYRADQAYGSHDEKLSSDYDRGERPGTRRDAENPHGAPGRPSGNEPENSKRPDVSIQKDVNEALSQHPDLDATGIEVQVQDGIVTLGGSVAERQFKRMAEDAAEQCSGVQDIRNEIRVRRASGETERSGSSPQGKKSAAAARG